MPLAGGRRTRVRHPLQIVSRCPDISESFLSGVGPTVTEVSLHGTLPWPGARAAGGAVISTLFVPPKIGVAAADLVVGCVAGVGCVVETNDILSATPVVQPDTGTNIITIIITTNITALSTVEAWTYRSSTLHQQLV